MSRHIFSAVLEGTSPDVPIFFSLFREHFLMRQLFFFGSEKSLPSSKPKPSVR